MNTQLNLNNLYKGVDSFELRLWITGYILPYKLLILKYANKKWISTRTDYWMESHELDSSQTYRLTLPNETERFIDSLKEFNILDLPPQDAIANFQDNVADGFNYTIEIASKDYYKIINYHCPDYFLNEYHNKRVTEFLLFLRRNLSNFLMCKT